MSLDLVHEFNNTNVEFQRLNEELTVENNRYYDYTKTLNNTVSRLVNDLAVSTESQLALKNSLDEYRVLSTKLEQEVLSLSMTTGDLNSTVKDLNDAIEVFQEENDRFRTIVSFLEGEANGVQKSYDELTKALGDTILRKRALAEIVVEERMKTELAGWECGLVTAFGTQQFAKDISNPIGSMYYNEVLTYTDNKILSDFCVNKEDFELFVKNEFVFNGDILWNINLGDFTRAVNIYTATALNYYFPDQGDKNGLQSEIWEEANYECKNLLQDTKFTFYR